MGKIRKALGSFSGKVGSVIGSNWNYISGIKSLLKKKTNSKTHKKAIKRTCKQQTSIYSETEAYPVSK